MFNCKRCDYPSISVFAKYRAGIWQDIYCSNCHARMACNPIILGAFYFFAYVQMTMWFLAMAYFNQDLTYLIYIVVFWVIFDILNVMLVPLVVLKPKQQQLQ